MLIVGVACSAALMTGTYGSHYEVIERHEDWHEGRWEKDFEVTEEERYAYGFKVFLYFLTASMIGYSAGRQKSIEERESYQRMFEELQKLRQRKS